MQSKSLCTIPLVLLSALRLYRDPNILLVLVLVLVLVLIPLKILEKVHPMQFQDSRVDNPYKCHFDRLGPVYKV